MTSQTLLQPLDYARLAVEAASEKQASDIVILDITGVSDFADYFVILTADSSRQINVLVEDIENTLEDQGSTLHHREGTSASGWVLLDFGDLIVHLFQQELRDFYDILGAWSQGVETVTIQ